MSTRRQRTQPVVPLALPVVEIRVTEHDELTITVDRESYAPNLASRGRRAVHDIVRELAHNLGPIRVELTEADGTTYTDIETPAGINDSQTEPEDRRADGAFQPGEEVMIVVVVGRRTASAEGNAPFRLPPALLVRDGVDIRLVGCTSGAVAAYDIAVEAVAS